MAKIIVSESVLARLRKEIAEHGTAILGPSSGDELYIVQPAGGFFEPDFRNVGERVSPVANASVPLGVSAGVGAAAR
jgi:hypothetical protein